uniref:Uncharacterized protein n=1 Tax=Zeugodacus cucurbitae TaxID=28588 RepID=A0A0A1WQL6_ZEUCU
MLQHTTKFNTQPTGKCRPTLFALVFVFSMTAFAFTEALQDTTSAEQLANANENEVNAKVVRILMSANDQQESAHVDKDSKFLLVNIEQQNDAEKLLATTIREQKQQQHKNKRDVNNTTTVNENNNNQSTVKQGYYEEQQPVVVHAETLPALGRRQDDFGAPPSGYQDAYYARPGSVYDDDEEEESQEDADGYPYEQQPTAGYYGGDNVDSNAAEESVADEAESVGEGRAAGNYDSYYRQWHYATPAPIQRPNGGWDVRDNRKLQNGERDPYAAYDADGPMEDYEYPGALTPSQKQQFEQQLLKRQQVQHKPQNRPQQTATMQQQQQAVQEADPHNRPSTTNNNNPSTENTLISTLKSLKTMWDIYRAFSAAWNTLATHRQQQEQQQQEAAKRRQQQIAQQMRINSKKPPKIGANDKYTQRNSTGGSVEGSEVTTGAGTNAAKRVKPNNKATKNPKTTTTTTTTTTSTEFVASSEAEETVANSSGSDGGGNNRNAGTKGDAMARQNAEGKREKRQTTDTAVTGSTDVGEGRYIKGDPLKGYYDFVITEGSYKFWAVFQTGTALLIIYSTFAAIYYSKVNPLVSDYDYIDYLGGARSLSGGDDDFIDDDGEGGAAAGGGKRRQGSWLDAMWPRAGRTMQYILDALDKLPVDHREADEAMRSERASEATTSGQATREDAATGNFSENENDDAARNEEDGSEETLEATDTETQRQVRAYAA